MPAALSKSLVPIPHPACEKTDSLDVVYATAEAENPAGARASRGAR